MKKIYLKPEMQVINIKTPQLLTASAPGLGGKYSGGVVRSRGMRGDYGDLDDDYEDED